MKQKIIAVNIGVDTSTISRELSRNNAKRGRNAGKYVAYNVHRKTDQRNLIKNKIVTLKN